MNNLSLHYGGPKVSRQFQFYSRQFQFFHGNAHGIFRFSHHLSATAAGSGHAPKVKTQNQKWIVKVDLQREKWNHNQKSISFHAFTDLKMNSGRSDFISVADPTRVTFVPVRDRTYRSHIKDRSITSFFFRMAPPFLFFDSKNRGTATNNISKQDLEAASMLGLMWGIEPFWDAVQQATRWLSDKAYNFLGPVNSSVVYSLSTGLSVR